MTKLGSKQRIGSRQCWQVYGPFKVNCIGRQFMTSHDLFLQCLEPAQLLETCVIWLQHCDTQIVIDVTHNWATSAPRQPSTSMASESTCSAARQLRCHSLSSQLKLNPSQYTTMPTTPCGGLCALSRLWRHATAVSVADASPIYFPTPS